MAANAPQTSISSEHLCKPRGLGLSYRRYRPSAQLIQASRPKRHSRSPPERSPSHAFDLLRQSHVKPISWCCRCRNARPEVITEYAQGCLNSPLPRDLKIITGRNCGWNASSRRARTQILTARAFRIDNRELIVGDVLAIVCFCLYKQVKILLSPLYNRLPTAVHHHAQLALRTSRGRI